MNLSTYSASVLDQQRAANLDRENELLRRQREAALEAAPAEARIRRSFFAKFHRPLTKQAATAN